MLERREVDERLEHRPGLPARADHAVVLRLVVGAAADEGEDLAGARIDGDQRRLRLPLAPRQHLVEPRQPFAQRILRDPLQVQVERRVDVDGAGGRVLRLQLLADVVDEVRRFGLERARHDLQRLAHGPLGASPLMKPVSAIARSTTLRRSFARSGLLNGERRDGDWMTPAMVAASASETLLMSLAKNSRAASATP